MNEAFPRCAVPGSSCRLLQLEAPGARPVWAVLDAAGTRHFTGEITMHLQPTVRAWFNGGELYHAEREGDAPLADRLVEMGVLTSDDLAVGSVQLGAVTHLGRLFDRVPDLDRDRVELALEILTGEIVGEIADHVVEDITIASYRHHPSGVVKWQKRPTVVISQVTATEETSAAPLAAPTRVSTPAVDLEPTAEDAAIVAEFEASLTAAPVVEQVELADPIAAVEQAEVVDPPIAAEDATAFEQPVVEQPAFEQPGFEQPAFEQPVVEPAAVESPTIEQPAFDELPVFEQPVAEPPVLEQPTFERPTFEQPVFEAPLPTSFDDAPAPGGVPAFDLSFGDLRAELEAELRAQFGTADAAHVEPIEQIEQIASDVAALPEPTVPAAPAAEVPWAIDDRVEWQVEAAAPAWQPDAPAATTPEPLGSAVERPVTGPVVEFDLQDILQQVQAEAAQPAPDAQDAVDADDDVRAAVRAALAEIEAATRSGGTDEIPSILMQAALADTEPGLPASTESWVQASLGQPDPADRVPAPPAVAARPVLPSITPTLPDDPAATGDDERPADPPSQEMPSTGGLRRTIGFRKP